NNASPYYRKSNPGSSGGNEIVSISVTLADDLVPLCERVASIVLFLLGLNWGADAYNTSVTLSTLSLASVYLGIFLQGFIFLVAAMAAGYLMSRWGTYKEFIVAEYGIGTISTGLLTILDEHTSYGVVIRTSSWMFLRTLGGVFGIAISDTFVQSSLTAAGASEYGQNVGCIADLPDTAKGPVLGAFVERACDPSRYEPDLALNLEICDVIKEKQKNTPREAAVYIVRLVNSRNMHVAMLALALLDNCVKNCGYPFHLQIATKEFLNELVRKFPERPMSVPTPVQSKVLEMIQEWYQTLCKTSRYKEDLVHIKDMHRLLSFKGYRFPQVKGDSAAVLNPVTVLKSSAELEEEDRAAQSAKLQELIRRGRPEDVIAANELVKKMTGYEQEEQPDYAEEALSELEKISQKAVLLTEMLNDVKPGEIIGRGDIFEDLLNTCKAAQPKIQKFISEGEDDVNMEKMLHINDVINNVIEQYNQVKRGNLVKAAIPGLVNDGGDNSNGSSVTAVQQESSLIDLVDFGESESTQQSSAPAPKTTGNLMDDLMNLSFNDGPPPVWGAPGSISLGMSAQSTGGNQSSSMPPGYNAFSSMGGSGSGSGSGSSTFNNSPLLTQGGLQTSRPTTPGHQIQSLQQTSSAIDSAFGDFDFVSNTGATAPSGPKIVTLLNKNGLLVELEVEYPNNDQSSIKLIAHFSNSLNNPLTALTFRVAVPKTLQLQLNPQSSQSVGAFSKRSVNQSMVINNPTKVYPVRIRYHLTYVIEGKNVEEQGEFSQFPEA
ncbi:hypothetical protein BGZ76_010324, partial [Entomortierella beljakovae]